MKCPKCGGECEAVEFRGVDVDRCMVCFGIWFDFAEHEELIGLTASELIDVGRDDIGEKMNAIRRLSCPGCDRLMVPLADAHQPHIEYEVCPGCYGMYFDSGEFADLKDFSLTERLRAALKGTAGL